MSFQDKFIAFVDILGFSEATRIAESDPARLSQLVKLTELLGRNDGQGHKICPGSKYISEDLGFKLTQISDCVVVSTEVSPAGVIRLITHCFGLTLLLLDEGELTRGFITRGNIYHTDTQFIGTGYINAYGGEREVSFLTTNELSLGTPFIQLDSDVVAYVRANDDGCVRKMFDRVTKSDGTNTAIWPFDRLATIPSAAIDESFDPKGWKLEIQKSIAYGLKNLAAFEAAESAATTERAKAQIRIFKNEMRKVIERLEHRSQQVDHMITTGVIPYGTII